MRFPAEFWLRIGGTMVYIRRKRVARKKTARKTTTVGHWHGISRVIEVMPSDAFLHVLNELQDIAHEATHGAEACYGIELRDTKGNDDPDRMGQFIAQFIDSLIEQGILAWGPNMVRPEAPADGEK